MPTDYELYYGFTRFAIELNELFPELKELLPPTDARFRPDQRYTHTSDVSLGFFSEETGSGLSLVC